MGNPSERFEMSELLARVTHQLAGLPPRASGMVPHPESRQGGAPESTLLASAARYFPPAGDLTVTPPTGFDFEAGVLFEGIVESAFLVVAAEGPFEDVERRAFTQVVLEASGHRVAPRQIEIILADLAGHLRMEGFEARVRRLKARLVKPVHRREALLFAVLVAEISEGISEAQRRVLDTLTSAFELPEALIAELRDCVRRGLSD
jgi:tellurite resistance protein